jgi:hypothetical protein
MRVVSFSLLPETSAAGAAAESAVLAQVDVVDVRARNRHERGTRAVPFAVVPRHMERHYNSCDPLCEEGLFRTLHHGSG